MPALTEMEEPSLELIGLAEEPVIETPEPRVPDAPLIGVSSQGFAGREEEFSEESEGPLVPALTEMEVSSLELIFPEEPVIETPEPLIPAMPFVEVISEVLTGESEILTGETELPGAAIFTSIAYEAELHSPAVSVREV